MRAESAGRYTAPTSGRDLVARPELEARLLRSVAGKRLTLIIAPAGSGKSMILSRLLSLCEAAGIRPAWLGCEEGDSDSGLWLHHVANALTYGLSRDAVAAPTVDELAVSIRRLGQPIALLLDNYDLAEGAEANAALSRLMRQCGPDFHVVLASRRTPALNLASLRLQSAVSEFARRDLAVESQELARFLGLAEDALPPDHRARLLELTDGWAAALQFVRLLLDDGADPAGMVDTLEGAGENIRHFLYEEVFASLSAEMQDYLLAIGHLDRFTADLGCAVAGNDRAGALFEEMIDRKLFVIPLDRHRTWVKLHSVFRDFLIVQARRDRPRILSETLLTAARWHWAQGDWAEAVRYALDAGSHQLAAEWLQACGERVITDRGEIAAFKACCQRIVDAGVASFDLIMWMVWTAAFSMSWMEASSLLSRHLNQIDETDSGASRLLLLRTLLTYFSHDFHATIELSGQWWDQGANGSPFDRATVAAMMTFSYKALLRRSLARPWLDRARLEIARAHSPYGRAWVHAIAASMAMLEGRTDAARAEVEQALGEPGHSAMAAAILEPVLADALYELDRCDEAAALAEKHIGGADGCAALEIAICAYRVLAMVRFRTDGPEVAINLVDHWRDPVLRRYGARGEAMLHLLRRDIVSRVSLERRRELDMRFGAPQPAGPSGDLSPDLVERSHLVGARLLLGDGRPQDALARVKGICLSAQHDGRWGIWVESGLIRACALRADGAVAKGEKVLIETIGRAAALGLRRSVLDHIIMLRPFGGFLARYAAAFKHIQPEERALIEALTAEIGVGPRGGRIAEERSPVEALTRQEARMLALLAEGLSNADICDRLVLSTATVKWHIYNLFQKMGVHSRTAAIREGRSLGLLD